MEQVSSSSYPVNHLLKIQSLTNFKKRVYVTQYIFCSALHILSRVASLEDQHHVYQ